MRALLTANMVFALVLPVIDIFVAAYVMRNSHDLWKVMSYQIAIYTGIPIAFAINGFLLSRVAIEHLYSAGMVLSGLSLVAMTWSNLVAPWQIAVFGVSMGLATGLFAANRVLLAISVTHDGNRDYYYGVEMSVLAIALVLVPLAAGWLIEGSAGHGWLGGGRNNGYRLVAVCVCGFSVIASVLVHRGRYMRPEKVRFAFFCFHPLWHRMLELAVLKGLAQGYLVTAPAMLVMLLVGQEGALGTVMAAGGILSSIALYAVGRAVKAQHRVAVFAAGSIIFVTGAVVNSALFNATGVVVFMACLLLAKPLLDLAYFPIQMLVIDTVSRIEGRNRYAYILSHEFGLYAGRLLGCGLFVVCAAAISDVAALKFALPVVGALQLLCIRAARKTLAETRLAADLERATAIGIAAS